MATRLGLNQYGKSESRVVRVYRDSAAHDIRDLNVSTSLRGDFEPAHTVGDQSMIMPTDSQKNTAFAYAKLHGVDSIEDYSIALGNRLLDATPAARQVQVRVQEYSWDRIGDHSFVRRRGGVRTCLATIAGDASTEDRDVQMLSGIEDLTVLNSTDS